MKKVKLFFLLFIPLLSIESIFAFCGFYVTKLDTKLFNQSSQVIIARHDDQTTITMSNDFTGNVKDFAMVVPVPTLLEKKDIKVVEQDIFDQFDAYSSPRLVEYFDAHPCHPIVAFDLSMPNSLSMMRAKSEMLEEESAIKHNVVIEAKYTIGEYDILILSAKESSGLKDWLMLNNYKIPEKAAAILRPYIKNQMKFFVVKVNLEKQKKRNTHLLRPIQISFESWKFGLPIRLGMANAKTAQDLIIYTLTEKGRVETANYRNVKIPSNINIPEFVESNFSGFYQSLFDKAYQEENKQAIFLEYAWDLDATNPVKCDPCPQMPPIYNYETLAKAGVDWIQPKTNVPGTNYTGNVFFTRMHVRYDRENFPQDLIFMETPNRARFQGRYVLQRAVSQEVDCEQGLDYLQTVKNRRLQELETLAELTEWEAENYSFYPAEFDHNIQSLQKKYGRSYQKGQLLPFSFSFGSFIIGLLLFALIAWLNTARKKFSRIS